MSKTKISKSKKITDSFDPETPKHKSGLGQFMSRLSKMADSGKGAFVTVTRVKAPRGSIHVDVTEIKLDKKAFSDNIRALVEHLDQYVFSHAESASKKSISTRK